MEFIINSLVVGLAVGVILIGFRFLGKVLKYFSKNIGPKENDWDEQSRIRKERMERIREKNKNPN
jgi:hypothetical protein